MTDSIRPVLESRIPHFARELYPRFVQFLKDYIDWLETDDNFLRLAEDFRKNIDVSNDADLYVAAILRDLGFDIEQDFAARKSLVVATLRDFLLARGTEKSFKYLFRLLFDSEVSVRYPREELLIPSHAEYGSRFFTYTTVANIQSETLQNAVSNIIEKGGELYGLVSKSSADIENIQIIFGLDGPYLEIETLQPVFPFLVSESVRISVDDETMIETIVPVLNFSVDSGGTGYTVGDQVIIEGASIQGRAQISAVSKGGIETILITSAGSGYDVGDRIRALNDDLSFGFSGKVVSIGGSGEITEVQIDNEGYNFQYVPTLNVHSVSGTGAVLTAAGSSIGAISAVQFLEPCLGYDGGSTYSISGNGTGATLTAGTKSQFEIKAWASRRGFISETSRLIDSDRYQQFSYAIVSPIARSAYESAVNEFLHPAGFVKFGVYEIVSEQTIQIGDDIPLDSVVITIESENPIIVYEDESEITLQPILEANVGTVMTPDVQPLITDTGQAIYISQG